MDRSPHVVRSRNVIVTYIIVAGDDVKLQTHREPMLHGISSVRSCIHVHGVIVLEAGIGDGGFELLK